MADEALVAELQSLRLGALKKRAAALGATEAALEVIDDAEAPKDAAIALVLRLEVGNMPEGMPTAGEPEAPPPPPPQPEPPGVMDLSKR